LNRSIRKATATTLLLLASTLLLAAFVSVNAQTTDQAVVIVLPSAGGTTVPAPGNYTYNANETINLEAIPDAGFSFAYWVVSGELTPGHTGQYGGFFTDPETGEVIQLPRPGTPSAIDSLVFTANPANITCGYGYTYAYQAVFSLSGGPVVTPTPPPQTEPPTSDKATVIIAPSIGGTVSIQPVGGSVTSPASGTYTFDNGTAFTLTATANTGFAFHLWTAQGSYQEGHLARPNFIPDVTEQIPTVPSNVYLPTQDSLAFANNPVTITCGYGYTYTYQAVFDPVGQTPPPLPTSTPPVPPTFTTPPSTTSTPIATSTPTQTTSPIATATPTPTPSGGDMTTTAIIVAVVVIIIIIIAVAVVAMRRKPAQST
jgi:hypothetical protein